MITAPPGVRIWLAARPVDMRKGFDGLAAVVQQQLGQDPFSGQIFAFRGKRGDLLKLLVWDGQGFLLVAKRLERGRFVWPSPAAERVRLAERIAAHVLAAGKLHADDTPVPVLAPGAGKTRTGRLWVYARDDRACADTTPPAVLYRYTPDRKGEHPQRQLAGWKGALQADSYAGFGALYETKGADPPAITEVACWAHVRRKFFDAHQAHKGAATKEVLERIGRLYGVEARVRGQPAAQRAAARQAEAKPEIAALRTRLEEVLGQVSGKSALAEAIRYALSRWPALTRYLADGRLEIDNNIAERAMRAVALGMKAWLFCGSDRGGQRAAIMYGLLTTAKLNDVDPQAWLADVLARINDIPQTRLRELLPWEWKAIREQTKAA